MLLCVCEQETECVFVAKYEHKKTQHTEKSLLYTHKAKTSLYVASSWCSYLVMVID